MNRFSSLLIAVAAITTGVASSQAAQIYSANFDGQSGNTATGVTGGTVTLHSTGLGTSTVETANSMGDGGYFHLVQQVGANYNVTAKLIPGSSATSLNAWSSAGGTALNGGFDFFMRPAANMAGGGEGALAAFVDPPTNGIGIALGGGWESTNFINLIGGGAGLFTNVEHIMGSQYSGNNVYIGNRTTQNLIGGQTYHMAGWFSTDLAGLVTAKFFILPGTGAIDPSSSTGLTGHVTFNVNAPGGLSTGSIDFGNPVGNSSGMTVDYDSFRLYDAAPATFAALAVPEPTTLSLLGLGALGLMARRRAATR